MPEPQWSGRNPASSSGGGAVTVLGPVTKTFEEIALDPPVDWGITIPAGVILLQAFAVNSSYDDVDAGATLAINLYPQGDLTSGRKIVQYDLENGLVSDRAFALVESTWEAGEAPLPLYNAHRSAVTLAACTLGLIGIGIAGSVGTFDFYAVTAAAGGGAAGELTSL